MFTGIIEEIGTVSRVTPGATSLQLAITCKKVLSDVNKGDSIAINGVCLTVSNFSGDHFTADVIPETVKATTLQELRAGSSVNLERAMAANGRFGGHIVSGHVDGTGEIISVRNVDNALYMEIEIEPQLLNYFIPKGSVTVDGTSLTVFGVTDKGFIISLIPVTQDDSVVGQKSVGDKVNIECDMMAKYIERLLTKREEKPSSSVTMDKLIATGFLD